MVLDVVYICFVILFYSLSELVKYDTSDFTFVDFAMRSATGLGGLDFPGRATHHQPQ